MTHKIGDAQAFKTENHKHENSILEKQEVKKKIC